ncbi:hypothetical protein [Cellulomonas hominis]
MDDELARARRALRGVDPDLDLGRVYAESRARAADPRVPAEVVEVRLAEPGARRAAAAVRRHRRVLVGAALAASVAVVGLVGGPSVVGQLPWRHDTAGPATTAAPTTTPAPAPTPSMSPAAVLALAAKAMSVAGVCAVQTDSALADTSASRVDRTESRTVDKPDLVLAREPLAALQEAAVDAVLRLEESLGTAEVAAAEYLGTEVLDGVEVARIRTAPPGPVLLGGEVTRVELLVDTTTWLPRAQEIWASSDDGTQFVLSSTFSWSTCDGGGKPLPSVSAPGG